MNKTFVSALLGLMWAGGAMAGDVTTVQSPGGTTWVKLSTVDGKPCYSAGMNANGTQTVMVEDSPLGLYTDLGDWSKNVTVKVKEQGEVKRSSQLSRTKTDHSDYAANSVTLGVSVPKSGGKGSWTYDIRFEVSDNNIAFRYEVPIQGDNRCLIVNGEATSFCFPTATTTFLCPQSDRKSGWKNTKPSYEEYYKADAPMTDRSQYGRGYTFPCLFHEGDNGWVLVSETGTTGNYVGCRLSDYTPGKGYQIGFPMEIENNGFGSTGAQLSLPATTPWRTLTMGQNLKPIVETTVMFDVVEQLYEPTIEYKPGRSSWSWIIWQDESMNYQDQITFARLAAEMGWEYILVDALWDTQVGDHKAMEKMFREIQAMGVDVFLWYNSNGGWNDAPQGARQCMDNPIARKKEMAWMKSVGVKGIKVDFFGGDKQETMRLYEAILSDANDYGIQVIFHGCTLPRGWEKMYPNYCASEAVRASENLYFNEQDCVLEAFNACLHPFIRNTVGSMDFGGTFLQRYMSRDAKSRHQRRTTDIFEMATAVVFQSHVQNFGLTPHDLKHQPQFEIDFMKEVPTTWNETRLIDGYPGKYVVLARRHGDKWYIAGLNAGKEPMKLTLDLPMFAGQTVQYYNDGKDGKTPQLTTLKVDKKGQAKVTLAPEGGIIIL